MTPKMVSNLNFIGTCLEGQEKFCGCLVGPNGEVEIFTDRNSVELQTEP